MKTNILLPGLCICAVAIGGASCSTQKQATNSATSHSSSHAGMNHNAANMPGNHGAMDHSTMNHSEMQSSPNAENAPYDLQFLDTMIAHHQGAVEMAKPAGAKAYTRRLKLWRKTLLPIRKKKSPR